MNSVEFDGRPACNNCGFCGYYGCPIDAKGDPVAPLRRALRTGRCEIRPESYVTDVAARRVGSKRSRRALPGPRPRSSTRSVRTTSSSRPARGRHRGCCCAPSSGTRTSSGASSQYHFQTFVLGIFPYRLHGHRGRSVTHLMDDPIVPDAARARRRARRGPPLHPGWHRRARCGGPPGAGSGVLAIGSVAHAAHDAGIADARPHGGVHHAGRGSAPGHQPHRARSAGEGRVRDSRRPGHLFASPPRDRVRRALGASPRGRHEGRRRGDRVLGHVPAAPGVVR